MKWKLVGVALAAAAIGTAVPIAAAQPHGNGHGRSNAPGQGVASQARNGSAPGGVLHVIQQSVATKAPGLTIALSHVPTIVPQMPTFPPPGG